MIDFETLRKVRDLINTHENLDDLLNALQELTQPEPKYKIGDTA